MTPALYTCTPDEPWIVSLKPWQRDMLGWVSITSICSLYYALPAYIIWVVVAACRGQRMTAALAALVFAFLSCAPQQERIGARRFFQVLYKIFNVRHTASPEEIEDMVKRWSEGQRFILGMHPHGVFPVQCLIWAAVADQYLRTPEHGTLYGFGGMATVITRMPFMRSLMGWLGGVGAEYKLLKKGLTGAVWKRPATGHNLYMLPGGLAEIFTAKPGDHTIVWNRRRGLCRLSLETGASLCPVYVFGGNDFFYQLSSSNSWFARTSRKFGISLTLFWGLPWLPTVPLVPKSGVTIAFAEPLPPKKTKSPDGRPTDAEIEEVHAAYVEAMQTMFEKYKAVAGYPEAKLHVA